MFLDKTEGHTEYEEQDLRKCTVPISASDTGRGIHFCLQHSWCTEIELSATVDTSRLLQWILLYEL